MREAKARKQAEIARATADEAVLRPVVDGAAATLRRSIAPRSPTAAKSAARPSRRSKRSSPMACSRPAARSRGCGRSSRMSCG
jgi:hypothetical protein